MDSIAASRAILLSVLTSFGFACTDSGPQEETARFATQVGALGECQPWASTVAGIAFSNAEATDTLAFVQNGSATQLDAVTYIGPTLAAAIIGARPFAQGPAGLQQLDAISGVGPTVLGALKAQTATLWCPTAGCCKVAGSGTTPASSLVINEFSLGSSGFLEVYNAGSAAVDLSGYSVDDIANAGSSPKKLAAGTSIAPKGYVVVSFAGFNSASADSVRLLDSAGKEVDVHANGYQGQSLAGVCRGRAPDGGPMAPHNLTCSPGQPNPGAVVPAFPIVTINEFKAGSFGWVEVFNANSAQAPLAGWSLDDKAGDPSPPVLLGNTLLGSKGFLSFAMGSLSATSADELRLIDPTGKVVETRSNGWTGSSIAGLCQGRLPDGGAWSSAPLSCSPGDINQGPEPPAASTPQVLITEISSGAAPWIELYNAGSTAVATQMLLVSPGNGSPAVLTQFLQGKAELAPKSYTQVPLPLAWLQSKQASSITLRYGPETGPWTLLDKTGNFYQFPDIDGKCAGRLPVAGPWHTDWLPCSNGLANPKPAPCNVGAPCNDGDPCTLGEKYSSTCNCGSSSPVGCSDGNPCTDDVCGLDQGCHNPDSANGTSCGSGKVCNFGNCAGTDPGLCTAKGGTYKGVVFTADQECKALAFLNKAPSSAFAWTASLIKLVYDCTPAGTCSYRSGKWTSLAQLTEKVGGCATSAGTATIQAIKDQSAGFVAGGPSFDTVASTWANKAKLGGRLITLESVVIEKYVKGTFADCWQIRDKAGASTYLYACYKPDNFCDGCGQSCPGECLAPFIGQKRWLRGTLESDSALPGGVRLRLIGISACGNTFAQFPANPAVP